MNIDNLSIEEIEALEMQKALMKFSPSGLHPDRTSVENMDEEQIRSLEAQRNRYDKMPTGLHPDRTSVENMDENQIKALEAQVLEKKQTDKPFKEYFENLISTHTIADEKEFEQAVLRSMESNGLIQIFVNNLVNEITKKSHAFKTLEPSEIENAKKEIEDLVNIYEKYLYTLKENGWSFDSIGFDVDSLKIPEDVTDQLWQAQKKHDITFNMLIPANLGEDYGKAFERNGKMIPGLTLMYEDLKGKSVNWHQVLIYAQNELTPYQKYKLRMQEKLKSQEQTESYEMKL